MHRNVFLSLTSLSLLACGDSFIASPVDTSVGGGVTTAQGGSGAAGASGGAGAMGGGGTGAGPPSNDCGKLDVYHDAFVGALSPQWVVDDNGVSADNGTLRIDPAVDARRNAWGWTGADFTETRMIVEVPQTTETSTDAVTAMQMTRPSGEYVAMAQQDGELWFAVWDGVSQQTDTDNYDPVEHRYWMIKETNDTLYFEVSSDGVSFTSLFEATSPAFTSMVELNFFVDNPSNLSSGVGSARFDNLNPESTMAWCPIDTFGDDFSTDRFNDLWFSGFEYGGCASFVTGGQLFLEFSQTLEASECYLASSTAYDFRGGAIEIEIGSLPQLSGEMEIWLGLRDVNGATMEIGVVREGLNTHLFTRPPVGTLPDFVAGMDTWRITDQGGSISFEVGDGNTFTQLGTASTPFETEGVRVIGGGWAPSGVANQMNVVINRID